MPNTKLPLHFGCPFFEFASLDDAMHNRVCCRLRVLGRWFFNFNVYYQDLYACGVVDDNHGKATLIAAKQAAKRQAESN